MSFHAAVAEAFSIPTRTAESWTTLDIPEESPNRGKIYQLRSDGRVTGVYKAGWAFGALHRLRSPLPPKTFVNPNFQPL